MTEPDIALRRCFQATFPELPAEAIETASVDTVEAWDSLRMVTLMSVLEEELDVQIPPEDLPELRSFAAVREYLTQKGRLS